MFFNKIEGLPTVRLVSFLKHFPNIIIGRVHFLVSSMIKSANQREEFTDRDSRKKALVKLFPARTADNILDHHYKLFGEVDSAGNLVVDSKGNVNTDSEILTRWHLHNTATEYAKTIPNQDARFDLELQAAKILPLAA